MTPEQARGLKAEVDAVSKQTVAVTAGLDASALLKSPSGGGWSVAENFQHLLLTADAMLPLLETAVARLERENCKATAPSSLGLMGWLLVKALEPPARMKSKTQKPFEPASVGDPSTLVARLQEANSRLDTLITRATGLATSTVKVVSPFNANVKYNLYAAFRIMLSHARRHLFQAEQVKAGRS
jgi:hypothetical protein